MALAIAAGRIASTPGLPIVAVARELTDPRSCLDALDTGDAATSARSVFSWSYRKLSGPAAHMFRLIGSHDGPDITVLAAASLAGLPGSHARRLLTELTEVHLATERVPGRFTVHPLIRAYAADLARVTLPAALPRPSRAWTAGPQELSLASGRPLIRRVGSTVPG